MEDTKAIRPEIKGLFDTIKNQAIQYADTFDKLEQCHADYIALTKDIKKINEELYLSINAEIYAFKQSYEDYIKLLKIESLKISQKYSELKDLKMLQDSYFDAKESIVTINQNLEKQNNELKILFDDFNSLVDSIKNSADEKIDDFLKASINRFNDTIKSDLKNTENKINQRISHHNNKISLIEKSLKNYYEKQILDTKNIYDEIDNLKKNVVNLFQISANKSNQSNNEIKKNEIKDNFSMLNSKYDELNDRIDTLANLLKDANKYKYSDSNQNFQSKSFSNEDKVLINNLNNQILELKSFQNKAIQISIGAVIIAIISIAIAFIL